MSGPPLTVPPPQDDDHEDVAWALRAASAQWRRAATDDAVHWVERAADTAQELGAAARAFELKLLAQQLAGRPPVAMAPPPPPGAVAPAPPSLRVSAPSLEVQEVDVDFDMDEDDVEFIEDEEDIEFVEEAEEVEAVEAAAPPPAPSSLPPPQSPVPHVPSAPPPPPSMAAPRPPSSDVGGPISRRSSTSPKLDMMPPSMRPEPSGLDLDEELEEETTDADVEFGELEFEEEAETRRVSVDSAPPAPDLGHLSFDDQTDLHLEDETAAEYAQTGIEAPPMHDDEDIEKELGVDLSMRGMDLPRPSQGSRPDLVVASEPPAPREWEDEQDEDTGEYHEPLGELGSHRGPDMAPPNPSSYPPGAISDHSPVPGRASVYPSQLPGAPARVTSAQSEPYGMAPSAVLPEAQEVARPPVIEPPSRPSYAPPPAEMAEPEHRPSYVPPSGDAASPSNVPPSSAAPDPDEFEEMFAALSKPPKAPSHPPQAAEMPFDAPVPTEFVSAPPQASLSGEASGASTVVDGVDLLDVEGFQDLPEDAATELAASAELNALRPNQEVSGFGVALVTSGSVMLMPTVADAPCLMARKGEVLFTQGTLEESAQVRVVGLTEDCRVAVFSKEALAQATSTCPWVADDLAQIADRYLAFAGAVLGPLGDSLDDMFRFMVLEKCSVKSKPEGAIVAEAGKPMDGMYILGGGALELLGPDGSVEEQLGMGDFVFPETVLSASSARKTVRVGKGGALLLYADRMGAHELLATCPPFIELLAG